jgi:phage FluMu protein Com
MWGEIMGDRYELNLKCAYCNRLQDEWVYYAPTCGFITFKCDKCKKTNFIHSIFKAGKIEELTYEEVYNCISDTTNFMDEKQVIAYSKQLFNKLRRKRLKK